MISNPVAARLAVDVAHILRGFAVEAPLTIAIAMAAVILDLAAHVGGKALPVTRPTRSTVLVDDAGGVGSGEAAPRRGSRRWQHLTDDEQVIGCSVSVEG